MSDSNCLQEIKLGQIGKLSTSSVDKKSVEGQAQVNLINYMDVYNGNTIDSKIDFMRVSASAVEKARSQVFCGDILFTPSSETPEDIGHSAVVAEELTDTLHSYHTVRLRPHFNDILDIRFSAWFANAEGVRKQFSQKCAGSTRYTLSIPAFESVICKIPKSLSAQRIIADYLDTVQATIEKTEALIHKYQQIKAGLMHDLFTRGLTANGKLRPPREQAPELYQETPIGWVPKEWDFDCIGNLFEIQLGKMLSKAAKTGKLSASYLGNKNVQWDRVDLTNLEKMDFNPVEREKFKLISGDLLVCEGGDVGRTSMWRDEMEVCFYQKAIHRLRPINEKIKPELMLRIMRHAKRTGVFTDFTSQSSIAHLTQEQLTKVKMFIPPLDEQSLMIERFDSIDNKINTETALLEKLKVQKSGLMHDLLTGKVPVKIDQEEPAHG